MKKKSNISFGPGASSLILIFVVLAMSVLGMLSLMNSRNDVRLSERSVQVSEAVYQLNVLAEEKRAQVDGMLFKIAKESDSQDAYLAAVEEALPEEMDLEDGEITWVETDGFRTLYCGLRLEPLGAENRSVWTHYNLTAETEGAW